MALRKILKSKAGTKRTAGSVQVPLDSQALAAAVEQLQETVNEVISRYNAHADAAHTGANKVTGTAVADTSLFTP